MGSTYMWALSGMLTIMGILIAFWNVTSLPWSTILVWVLSSVLADFSICIYTCISFHMLLLWQQKDSLFCLDSCIEPKSSLVFTFTYLIYWAKALWILYFNVVELHKLLVDCQARSKASWEFLALLFYANKFSTFYFACSFVGHFLIAALSGDAWETESFSILSRFWHSLQLFFWTTVVPLGYCHKGCVTCWS